jgi:hypothetical protein
MSARSHPTLGTTSLRLSYAGYADHATGQIGEPALARPVPLAEGVLGFFRRSGTPDLVSFHVEHFSTSFERLDHARLADALGGETVSALRRLWEKVPAQLPQLSGLAEEELSHVMRASVVGEEVEIPLPSAAQRDIWRQIVEAWEKGPEVSESPPFVLRIRRDLLSKSRELAQSMKDLATATTDAILNGVRVRGETLPALSASGGRAGVRHDHFVWEETGDDPVRIELGEDGDMLWATGFATAELGGAPITVRLRLKQQLVEKGLVEADLDLETGELVASGTIETDGRFRLRLGSTKGKSLPEDLVDGFEVVVG